MEMDTIIGYFNRYVIQRPDATFILTLKDDGIESLTWSSAGKCVMSLAGSLLEKGVKRGDRIAILSENRCEWVMADLAIMSAGAVSVLISARVLTVEDIIARLRNSDSRMVFVSAKYKKMLEECSTGLPTEELICFDDATYSSLFTRQPSACTEYVPCLDDTSTIMYTSGTTSSPRGVELTYRNYFEACSTNTCSDLFFEGFTTMCTLPLDHSMMHLYLSIVIMKGGTMAIMRHRVNPVEAMLVLEEDIRASRPDILIMVPAMLSGLSRIMQIKGADKSIEQVRSFFGGNLKFMMVGGARVEDSIVEFFQEAGIPVYSLYGMTETTGGVAINLRPIEKIGSIGYPVGNPRYLMLYSGGGTYHSEAGVSGEIVYRGGGLMKGYWHNDDATSKMIDSQGWFHTGDIGHFDTDGYLYFEGREKNLLVSNSGEKYDPEDIENAIKLASESIGQVMVYNQESPCTIAIVVTAIGKNRISVKELDSVIKHFSKDGKYYGRFPEIWIPKRFLILDEPFSVENGMLTPKGSISRRTVYLKYKNEIEALWYNPVL